MSESVIHRVVLPRRQFVHSLVSGSTLLGLGGLSYLSRLRPVTAEEAKWDASSVRFSPDIEPLVQLLEETPRERLLEEVAHRVHRGLSYRELVAALLLAGVRNVQPRPSVGFKFHAVLVVNSAHLASLASPAADRWLPIFWALDYFKSSQAQDEREGNWTMPPVDEAAVPSGDSAGSAFCRAMDAWDEQSADAAVAGLARSAGATEIFELLARYAARDFRSIGHKAIFLANAWRTLGCIGWRYAEPVLRSLTYALLNHVGEPNPAASDLEPDRPGRENIERAARLRNDWLVGQHDDGQVRQLAVGLRTTSAGEAAELVLQLVNGGADPQTIWDGLFLHAAELLTRQPGIIGLHTLTTTNALYYTFQHCGDPDTRRWLMLQNASFLTLFRDQMPRRGPVGETELDQLEPSAAGDKADRVAEIFARVRQDGLSATRQALGYLHEGGDAESLIQAARVLVFLKGDDSHDYKFSSAVLEDYYHVSPAWRDRLLAASMVQLRGSHESDNPLVQRIRQALA